MHIVWNLLKAATSNLITKAKQQPPIPVHPRNFLLLDQYNQVEIVDIDSYDYLYPESYRDPCFSEASVEQWQVFSLGCVIYECATLKSHYIYWDTNLNDTNPFLAEPLWFPSDFDKDLQTLLSQMMSKTPAARPSLETILQQATKAIDTHHYALTHEDQMTIFRTPDKSYPDFFNYYRVLRDISSGGFGTACLVEHIGYDGKMMYNHPDKGKLFVAKSSF